MLLEHKADVGDKSNPPLQPCTLPQCPHDWKFILLKQMAKAQKGKPYHSNTFPAFACVESANISLAKASHVA